MFLALVLSLLVALTASCLASAQMAAARVQIACGLDIGLYSLFAQYDSCLLEEFDLFYLDGSFGGEQLNLSKVYDTVADYMKPVLNQNYQNLTLDSGGITGFRLATDNQGASFRSQVITYMEETLGSQGIRLLLEKIERGSNDVQEQQNTKADAQLGGSPEDYDRILEEAAANQPGSTDEEGSPVAPDDTVTEIPTVTPEPIANPIDTIRQIQNMGILELILPNAQSVSQKTADLSTLASHRTLQQGMGAITAQNSRDSATDKILFQEYLLLKSGNYRNPVSDGILSYPIEYIIGGNSSDIENLKSTANRLLLIREGINFVYLLTDAAKRSQASALAAAIASALLVPMAAGIVEMVLLACWAFAESILDLRELFDGGKIPLIKTAENWQIALENLGQLLGRLDTDRKEDSEGLSYEDYLRVLLFMESSQSQTLKCMDVFELTVRGKEGYSSFCMDSCIDALEIEMDVNANSRKTFQVRQQYGYNL